MQRRFNVGPVRKTMGQQLSNTGTIPRVCWDMATIGIAIIGHSNNPANKKHLYNICTMGRRCINVMQMFCAC